MNQAALRFASIHVSVSQRTPPRWRRLLNALPFIAQGKAMRNMSTLMIATYCRTVLDVVLLLFVSHNAFAAQVAPSPVPNFTMDNGVGLPFYYNDSTKNLFVGFTFTYPVAFTATNVILHTCDSVGMRISFSQGNNVNDRVASPILAYGTATSTALPCPNGNSSDVTSDVYAVTYDFGKSVTFQANVQIYAQFIAITTDGSVGAPYPYGSQGLVGAGLNYPVSELQFCYSFFCGAPSWSYATSTPTTYSTAFRFTAASTATPPVATLSAPSLDFGLIPIGSIKQLSLTIGNTGGSALSGTVTSSSWFTLAPSGLLNVATGGSQTFNVTFAPTTTGIFQGTLTLNTNGGVFAVPVQGVATTTSSNPAAPKIDSISMNPAIPGTQVKISGSNFGIKPGTLTLDSVNVTPTAPNDWNDTFVNIIVPALGPNKYAVTVKNAGGSASTKLTVLLPAPTITNLLPNGGAVGSTLWIDGFSFGAQQNLSSVTLGGVQAPVIFWGNTRVGIKVPTVKVGAQQVIVMTQSGTTPSAKFRVRDIILTSQYDACDAIISFSTCPPIIVSAKVSDTVPGGYDITIENVVDRWYLVGLSTVGMTVPINNNFVLLPVIADSFLLGPTSARTFTGVMVSALPARIAFVANGTSPFASGALAADMFYRLATGSHLPTDLAEAFALAVTSNFALAGFMNDLRLGILNRDIVSVLGTLTTVGKLLDDPTVFDIISNTMKLTPKRLSVLRGISDVSKYGQVWSVLLEEFAQLTAPRSATASLEAH